MFCCRPSYKRLVIEPFLFTQALKRMGLDEKVANVFVSNILHCLQNLYVNDRYVWERCRCRQRK